MLLVPNETRDRLRAERDRQPLPPARIMGLLKGVGLRPTRQRVALGAFLFLGGHRHLTADDLHRDAIDAGVTLSLATVYNTLNQFSEAGLIRRVCVNGERTYFDTDAGDHHHFYVEAEDRIIDIPPGQVRFGKLPEPPAGYVITKIDVVIRLSRIEESAAHNCCGSAASACTHCDGRACGTPRSIAEIACAQEQEWKVHR